MRAKTIENLSSILTFERPEELIGLKVTRGPTWIWRDQDGGAGGQGTIVSSDEDNGWIAVRWDYGSEYNYRLGIGPEKQFFEDLLIVGRAGCVTKHKVQY